MSVSKQFLDLGEYAAAGMFEEPERSVFYRKALGLRRYWENCRLPEYTGRPLYPSGKLDRDYRIATDFMFGFCLNADKKSLPEELEQAFLRDFDRYHSSVPKEHTIAGDMAEHSIPHYERVLKEGLLSYIPRIEKIEDRDMREGLLQILEGIRCWITRCTAYLKEQGADETLIRALEKVPLHPAENIYEAVLSWNAVMYLDGCDNLGCVAAGLLPWYRGEDITGLLGNLFDNLDVNNGYSMALGMEYSPLTLQCLEASCGRRRPMIELFVDETTPEEVWQKAFADVRSQSGQPAFYNPRGFFEGLKKRIPELTDEDLRHFCGCGCTESEIAGMTNCGSIDAGINTLFILERSLKNHLQDAESFEEFYRLFMDDVRSDVTKVLDAICSSQLERAKYNPLPMRTLLMDDCIDRQKEYNDGGTRFGWSLVSFGGMINVIDSLLVIRDLVFRDKRFSPKEVLSLLAKSDEAFLSVCRHHNVSFGNDNADANALAHRVSAQLYDMLEGRKPYYGSAFLPCSIMFRSVAIYGKQVGATPDGRSAGYPLCDSIGAIFGKDTKGPTALLNSVASLDLPRAVGTPVLNFCIDPAISDSNLKALILGFMALGGMQMQISCVSAEVLKDAYEHPDLHRNLVVRVGGYSDYFNNLTDEMKKVVISRSIHC